jgi:two-component system cell cycle sensor histidine kinase/response regulator CckA
VILSSGYTEQDATNQFAEKGLAGFIQKPYEFKTLMAKIHQVFGAIDSHP